jgi:hypothetical protein
MKRLASAIRAHQYVQAFAGYYVGKLRRFSTATITETISGFFAASIQRPDDAKPPPS